MACTTVLPPSSSDLCTVNAHFGEINQLYFTRLTDPLEDWEDNAEWLTRLSNSTTLPSPGTDAPIRTLFGIGSLAAPEKTEIPVSRNRSVFTNPKYTMVFNVEDTGDTNMALVSAIPVAGQQYAAWFGTEERLFGGNAGVLMTMTADPVIPESADELMKIQVTLTFKGTFPEVIDNHLS